MMLIKDKFAVWQKECDDRENTLNANEKELNHIFIRNLRNIADALSKDPLTAEEKRQNRAAK